MVKINWTAVVTYLEEVENARGKHTPLTVGVFARALKAGLQPSDKPDEINNVASMNDALIRGVGARKTYLTDKELNDGINNLFQPRIDPNEIYNKTNEQLITVQIEVIKTCLTVLSTIRELMPADKSIIHINRPEHLSKDIILAIAGCRDALGMDKENKLADVLKPYISWQPVGNGIWAAVKMTWYSDLNEYAVYEISQDRYRNEIAAQIDAREWAKREGLECKA